MPEKRNIYYLQLIVLKFSGSWNPFLTTDPLWQRVLYTIWRSYVICQCIFWEICGALFIIYNYKTADMSDLTIGTAYLMQLFLGNAKMLIVNYRRKDMEWLVEETALAPFYRENDELFKTNLRESVAKSTKYTRVFWLFTFLAINMSAFNAFIFTVKSSYSMKNNCDRKLNNYRERFKDSNNTLPEISGNLKAYQQINLIENFIDENRILDVNTEIVCERPLKKLAFGAYTPYDHQKHFVISFLLQWTTYWLYATYICPLDLLIMSSIIHLRFQFSCVIKDLLSMREDCIKIVNKKLLGRKIDEKCLIVEIKNRFKSIILHHEHIFKYYNISEEVFTWVLFAQYFGTSIMMCMLLFELAFSNMISLKFLEICSFMSVIIFQLYINCYYGTELVIESEDVATAAFQCGWENSGRYSTQLKNYILMIMCRSLRPTRLSAGKFAYINLDTFMRIMKSSYSYYTVMSNGKK